SELNVTDRPNRFKIKKVDKDTGEALKDAKFEIYDVTADKTVGSLVSNKNGEAELSRLKPSLYYICEVKAPEGYKLNETKYYFEIDSLGNASVS
ncbi:prealbumin-like fold domain-containing protein, partial [Thomasclavelia ramosa]|uniref:prealbumin-like fold domain-containing protein n=2 Tax=Coprobacillaceae TaxID=2810280 RepID=UPI001D028AA6